MEFTIRGFKSHSGQLSITTSKNLSVVNNNNNNIYIYIYIYISTYQLFMHFYALMINFHRMVVSKRHFLKKSVIFWFVQKHCALTKSRKTLSNLNHSKKPKEQLKVESKQ